MNLSDTIIALATPPGVGAIGVIRLSGEDAIVLADRFFHGKPLNEQPSHTIHFGTIRDETGRIVDEVLVSLFIAPRSYTGENVVEISCHGSNYILEEVIRLFIRAGVRQAQPGEFTLRAFLNGRMDLSQAEAVADLIASASSGAHKLAIAQLRGGVSDEIKRLRQELLDFASLIELELDFSEEDVEFADRTQLHHLIDRIQTLIKALLDSFQLGNAIRQGVSTVIAGRPNAGKSTLLNALLNEERAIVSEIAGTTRDTIEETLNIQGIQFRIIDTAGIREAHDTIEALGVERTLEKVRQSAVLVYVFDVVKTSPEQVRHDLAQLIHPDLKVLVVANKMDLNPYTQFEHYFEGTGSREQGRD
ncbi:MAG: tRNA uridine-5-carboxymethylaminomethyl(34) synthesis GTPase MnmE [Haliscomenobacter sp.]|nr:tRNA uridine-5-carboxymethylaminomethyl(34) synthesis GTPase MnmE [Haliscomenobacter sp.]